MFLGHRIFRFRWPIGERQQLVDPDKPGPPAIVLPWSVATYTVVKGVIHTPEQPQTLSAERRQALLTAIAKAPRWVDDLAAGRVTSFAEIAAREGKVERLIRLPAPLAFLSPQIITATVEGRAPVGLTVIKLAKALPYSWLQQECQAASRPGMIGICAQTQT